MNNKHRFWLGVAVGFVLTSAPLYVNSCGALQPEPEDIQVNVPPAPRPDQPTCPDGSALGTTRRSNCPVGQLGEVLEVCRAGQWVEEVRTCENLPDRCEETTTNKITWDRHIRPIVENDCISCHTTPLPFNSYQVVAADDFRLAKDFVRRINLDGANADVMPPRPRPRLSDDQVRLFEQWARDGYLENNECYDEDPSGNAFIYQELEVIGQEQLLDLNSLPAEDRPFTRFLLCSHKYNTRDSVSDMQQYRNGVQKSVNSLSQVDQEIYKAIAIDDRKTIWRIDLRNYGLTQFDWELIVGVEPFDFIDNTSVGQLIQQLTGTRQPWLHADNFIFTAMGDPEVYNRLMRLPQHIDDLYRQLGVNYDNDFLDFDAIMVGFNGSPISGNKNRLLTRHESTTGPRNRGYMWQTYDPNNIFLAEKNLFQFPLLPEADGNANFLFDAGEIIWSLDNGLLGYALYDAQGILQTFAPTNIVIDNRPNAFDPDIETGLDCAGCHGRGLLPAQDQIRASVLGNAAEFDNEDVDKVKLLYPEQSSITAAFTRDNAIHTQAIADLGFNIFQTDPMNFFTDRHRDDWTLEEVAAFVFFTPDRFRQELSESADARGQIGQLLSGGTITLGQLEEVFPVLIRDFRLGLDPLDEQ